MKKIVFAGGGTAGHVMPNLALIDELKSEYHCIYVGGSGMERGLCEACGIPFYEIKTVKLRRDAFFKNAAVPFKLLSCVRAAKKTLAELSPDLIFSKGGYAALPAVLAAKPLGVPLLCHESDLTPGIVTKLGKKRAQKVLCAFEPCAELFPNGMHVGTPLRKELYRARAVGAREKALRSLELSGNKPVLLIMGGSSGAATLNACAERAIDSLVKTFDVVHITGKNKSGCAPRAGYRKTEFCDDMPMLYAAADACVSRAGANALAELVALGIPTVAVPLEKASRGDQIQNAEYFSERGAVSVLREKDLTAEALAIAAADVYRKRLEYAAAMKKLTVDGTAEICAVIKDILK